MDEKTTLNRAKLPAFKPGYKLLGIFQKSPSYQPMPDEDPVKDEVKRDGIVHWCYIPFAYRACMGVLMISLVVLAIMGLQPDHNNTDVYRLDARKHRCGKTPKEARELGCHFDVVTFAWVPEECLDEELAAEFRLQNFTWYNDPAGTATHTEEELAEDLYDHWITQGDHATHCFFAWKKTHRAIEAGRPLHGGLTKWKHTLHCGDVLLSKEDPKSISGHVRLKYPLC
ncbi:hypothetical protein HBI56_193700 [Parastagonospora nodorum]|uniref:Uncharacterized protein n=2 Tax=Phaeosphaeria nodorum (strain SN15 / ATCC MYA-4574 / FGSC 10173) TaxID=321614 RepID=A0A7U2I0E6_PHANO|nr:hypothetical protein SNOG_14929 [Parastagonospora nodorum SN15]KAH3906220.1 hypothetical protein HBH56_205340 [Parastagonospora nodorum]EAT77781.1 hypothetical protein SNOG_14929 [Parastagonospora nodorum SN15]KAH3923846.1 hypothetical protein HBH54_204210 [Parastagonospora nodorum]KAH3942333.1 hypothetical protein HBH53_190120 [Parastagonospora nodorum]KAH3962368.1 hypothetical protein HBH51_175500 [Parastagonospora nodorum]